MIEDSFHTNSYKKLKHHLRHQELDTFDYIICKLPRKKVFFFIFFSIFFNFLCWSIIFGFRFCRSFFLRSLFFCLFFLSNLFFWLSFLRYFFIFRSHFRCFLNRLLLLLFIKRFLWLLRFRRADRLLYNNSFFASHLSY